MPVPVEEFHCKDGSRNYESLSKELHCEGIMTDAWEALAYIQSMNKQAPEGPHILWWHPEAPGPAKGLI